MQTEISDRIHALTGQWLAASDRPLVVGICGAQGSGKSTAAGQLAEALQADGINAAVLSLDDLYLGKDRRRELAASQHPLFATRGPPGTHDVELGVGIFAALRAGEPVELPRFDKAADEPGPRSEPTRAPCDVVIFEGWCVGARAQTGTALDDPANALERESDADGIWRGYANAKLAGEYQALFSFIDRLVLLKAPDFDVVRGWRIEQERDLEARTGSRGMSDKEIERFIQHYERITRHIMREMPDRADLTIELDQNRGVQAMRVRTA